MVASNYKKMAGTSAVFLIANHSKASPVERDGMSWSAEELHMDELTNKCRRKEPMANALALEGLEEYEPPENGDLRRVESIDGEFVYFDLVKGWIQIN